MTPRVRNLDKTTEEASQIRTAGWKENVWSLKSGERRRISTNKEIKDTLQGTVNLKFTKSLGQRWCCHVERMQDQRIPKRTAIDTVKGTRKRGGPYKKWRDKVEKDINYGNNKTGKKWPEIVWNGGRLYWKPSSKQTVELEKEKKKKM
jgi:hypothetical protein